jgi:hypothetical protein
MLSLGGRRVADGRGTGSILWRLFGSGFSSFFSAFLFQLLQLASSTSSRFFGFFFNFFDIFFQFILLSLLLITFLFPFFYLPGPFEWGTFTGSWFLSRGLLPSSFLGRQT